MVRRIKLLIVILVAIAGGQSALAQAGPAGSKGAVPHSRIVYSVLEKAATYNLHNLDNLYRLDMKDASLEYITGLKNMWFPILNKRIAAEGDDTLKRFYINEQIAAENNLSDFSGFYNLLLSASISNEEKMATASRFYDKNEKAIAAAEWKSDKEKENKMTELALAGRNFYGSVSAKN